MAYEPPQLKELENVARELKNLYKGTNSQRVSFINLLEHITNHTHSLSYDAITDILMGALVFELEIIREKEYLGHSPNKRQGWIYTSGSELYTAIKNKLGITEKNILHDDERLIDLFKFYQFVEKSVSDNELKKLCWQNKKNLIQDVKVTLKAVKNREIDRIELLANGIPKLMALRKNILSIFPDYEKASKSRWFNNPKREKMLKTISLVCQTCDDFYPIHTLVNHHDNLAEDSARSVAYMQSCNIQLGTIMSSLLIINNEYTVLSPERSVLFKKCLHAINAKKLNGIDGDKKIIWLKALSNHITNIKANDIYYNNLKQKYGKEQVDDLEKFRLKVDKLIVEEEEAKKNTRSKQYLSSAAQYGISFAITQFAKDLTLPALGGAVIGATLGPVGMVIYGTAGTIIMTQLGRLVANSLLPRAVAHIYAYLLDKIGNAVAGTTVGMMTYTFSATKQGFRALLGHPGLKEKDRAFITEWINTLLALPDDIMSPEEKAQIRYVLGDENEPEEIYQQTSAYGVG